VEVNAVARVTDCKTVLMPLDQLLYPNDALYRATVTMADVPLDIISVLMQQMWEDDVYTPVCLGLTQRSFYSLRQRMSMG
jgi:hypothetical protein